MIIFKHIFCSLNIHPQGVGALGQSGWSVSRRFESGEGTKKHCCFFQLKPIETW